MPTITKPERVSAWRDSSGKLHEDIKTWQDAELQALYATHYGEELSSPELIGECERFAGIALEKSDLLLAILTTGPRSRPRTRKAAGTTNPQRAVARVNLQLTLADIRRVTGWTDDEIITHISDRSVKKVRGIGEAKFSVLQEWAAGQGMAKMGFARMREAASGGDPSIEQGTDVPATPPTETCNDYTAEGARAEAAMHGKI